MLPIELTFVVHNALVKGLLFSLLFTVILFIHHFYGPGPDVRDEAGKKVIPPEFKRFVITEMIVLVALMLGFAFWANLTLSHQLQESPSFFWVGSAILWGAVVRQFVGSGRHRLDIGGAVSTGMLGVAGYSLLQPDEASYDRLAQRQLYHLDSLPFGSWVVLCQFAVNRESRPAGPVGRSLGKTTSQVVVRI